MSGAGVKIVKEFEFRSKSNPDRKPYVVKVYDDGTMSCDCRGWTFKKVGKPRGCTHTKQVAMLSTGVAKVPVMKKKRLDRGVRAVRNVNTIDRLPSSPQKQTLNLPVMRPNDGSLKYMENSNTIVQLKYDGTYAFVIKKDNQVTMPGRSFKSDFTQNHPEFVRDALKAPFHEYILAGELVFLDDNGKDYFLTALAKEETWLNLGYTPRYMVFDILNYQGRDTTNWTWLERNSILLHIFKEAQFETFELITNYVTLRDKRHAWEICNEGIVIKDIYNTITDGRTNAWRKVKKLQTEDFWGIGLTKGTGARESTFGAMLIANKLKDGSFEYITKTSGFTNAQLVHFLETLMRNDKLPVIGKLPPNLMYLTDPVLVEIKYQRKTETGSLIMPRFVKERTDIEVK